MTDHDGQSAVALIAPIESTAYGKDLVMLSLGRNSPNLLIDDQIFID